MTFKNQIVWLTQTNGDGTKHIVTSNKTRDKYYLYISKDDKTEKVATSNTPQFKLLETTKE